MPRADRADHQRNFGVVGREELLIQGRKTEFGVVISVNDPIESPRVVRELDRREGAMRPGVAFALVLFVVVGKADRAKGDVCRVRSEQVPNLRQVGRPPMCYAVFALLVAAVEDDHDRRVGLPLLERLAEQTLPVCREGRRVRQRHAAAVKLRDSVVVAIDTLGHDRHTRPSRHFRPRFCAEEAAREHSETRRGTRPHLSFSRVSFFSR